MTIARTLNFVIIAPDRLWQSGDMGMVRALEYRAQGRGLRINWEVCNYGEPLELNQASAVIIGGRTIANPSSLMDDLDRLKKRVLLEAVEEGVPLFAQGAGLALCSDAFESVNGRRYNGLGIFDTISLRPSLRARSGDLVLWAPWLSEAPDYSGNITAPVRTELSNVDVSAKELILGYEKQGRRFVNVSGDQALGQILYSTDKHIEREYEGIRQGTAIGTHAQGSLLPLNPALTDRILSNALGFLDAGPLAPMSSVAETKVRMRIMERILHED